MKVEFNLINYYFTVAEYKKFVKTREARGYPHSVVNFMTWVKKITKKL